MAHVRDIMGKNVITIKHDRTSLDAAMMLDEKKISFLVIMKDGQPAGLVTERDFVRKVVAQNRLPEHVPLVEIMSESFRWVAPDSKIEDAVQKMLNNSIRRLLVLEDEKLVGVVTQTDLTEFLRSKLLINGTVEKL